MAAFLGPNGRQVHHHEDPHQVSRATDRIDAAERRGYLPENGPIYPNMTPLGLLKFFGRARSLTGAYLQQRIDAVSARCAEILGP